MLLNELSAEVMQKFIRILLLAFPLFSIKLSAQTDEVFTELEIGYIYVNNEKWRGDAVAKWKHIYDEIGWRKWGAEAGISRKLKSISIEGGAALYYTFDKDITNYLEIRPWLGLRSDLDMGKRLLLIQKFKVENRNLLYDDRFRNESFLRSRYLLSFRYDFLKNRKDWKLNPAAEWYFIGKKADAERFVNSFEASLKVMKILKNENEIAVGYKLESFKESEVTGDLGNGHSFIIEYTF